MEETKRKLASKKVVKKAVTVLTVTTRIMGKQMLMKVKITEQLTQREKEEEQVWQLEVEEELTKEAQVMVVKEEEVPLATEVKASEEDLVLIEVVTTDHLEAVQEAVLEVILEVLPEEVSEVSQEAHSEEVQEEVKEKIQE